MGGTPVEVGLTSFQEPDQGADQQQQAEQRADGYEHLKGESTGEAAEHAALRLVAHRDAEACCEIGMGEVEPRLALERDRNGGDRRIDLALLDGIEQARKIVVIGAKLVGNLQLRGDLFPQLDAEPRPLPIVAAHDERRHAHGADDDLRRRLDLWRLRV